MKEPGRKSCPKWDQLLQQKTLSLGGVSGGGPIRGDAGTKFLVQIADLDEISSFCKSGRLKGDGAEESWGMLLGGVFRQVPF